MLLSFVFWVFDLIGLVAPYSMRVRFLLNEVWIVSGQKNTNYIPAYPS